MGYDWMRFDGARLSAWWEAKLHSPQDWGAFITLPLIAGQPSEVQREIWESLGRAE